MNNIISPQSTNITNSILSSYRIIRIRKDLIYFIKQN